MDPFPVEIALKITNDLSERDIFECMKVCHLWYSGLSPIFYRTIQLHENFFEQITETRLDGRRIGDFVQCLKLTWGSHVLDKDEFCRMLDNLPRLQVIHFFYNNLRHYSKFIDSIQAEKLDRLQEFIVHGMSSDSRSRYIDSSTVLKEKITKLYIRDIATRQLHFKGSDFFTTLSCLKNLNSLEVISGMHMPNYHTLLLDFCSSLTSLRFTSTCSCLAYNDGPVIIHKNLKSLELDVDRGFTYKHLDQIMECLPNITKLKLSPIVSDGLDPLLFDLSTERAQKFLNYLKGMTNFEFQEIQPFYDSVRGHPIQAKDKSLWLYIHELIGNGYTCNLKLGTNEDEQQLFISADRKKKLITVGITWLEKVSQEIMCTEVMEFLSFRRISITARPTTGFTRNIIRPLIALLKKEVTSQPSYLLIKNFKRKQMIDPVILKLVDSKSFSNIGKEQRIKSTAEKRKLTVGQKASSDLFKTIQKILQEDILEIRNSSGDAEYLINRINC